MKAYGVPRVCDVEFVDGHSHWLYGLKGRRIKNKTKTRRIWKKRARAIGLRELQRELQ